MTISLLTIGDELLNGDLADTNTAAIAKRLGEESYLIQRSETVGDQLEIMVDALRRHAQQADAVIVTGGLGPTEDDRTAKAAAAAFERPLALNDVALQQIRERFRAWNRPMHPGNEKQALLPARAKIITNKRGTAPGFHINSGNCELFFTPGVPSEMLAMLEDYILPALQERLPNPPLRLQRILNVFGLAEPEVESRILKAGLPEGVELAFAVEFSVVQVKLRATGPEAGALIDQAELRVRQTLGDNLFGYGGQTLAEVTASLFCVTELSLALAESCTGGLIAKLLTDQPGASAFLERSIVSYANSAKTSCLDVPAQLLEEHGAVSAECAEAMVTGLAKAAQTDITLAVTGIAGPGGGTAEKPVGCVYIAMQSDGKLRVERFLFPGNRAQVRLRTALTALDWLRKQANRSLLEPSFDVSPEGPQEVFQEGKP